MLSEGLKAFERHKSGTLEKLSNISPRSKHIVARDRYTLFNNTELSENYSEVLIDDWWYGTNNSAQETEAWLRRGAELCGLKWDKDITTSL